MNQDQLKSLLLKLEDEVDDFTLLYSGKESKKVDGLYKPDTREIIIHNKNHKTENEIIYTGIHEFAHHINCTKSAKPVTSRSHTVIFWDIFHRLLYKAEHAGIYNNIFKTDPDFQDLTKSIKENYLSLNGNLMKEFGAKLMVAMQLCQEKNVSFEDYVDRELGLHRTAAKTLVKTYEHNVNPEIGYENMKTVAKIKNNEIREQVQAAFLNGNSPDMVKASFSKHIREQQEMSRIEFLEQEKDRVKETVERLKNRLVELESEIRKMRKSGESGTDEIFAGDATDE
ncbi:MAG: hypothetical protein JW982_04895 [Spirochaetes bacterium]|nr:hypothetical protein [Spirochaetota bacterium]